jgi:membrane fusion protein (multidrug efflux system)
MYNEERQTGEMTREQLESEGEATQGFGEVRAEAPGRAQERPPAETAASTQEPLHAAQDPAAAPQGKSRRGLRLALAAVALLALGAGVYYGHYWWTAGRYLVSTDDAYVGAKSAVLSPKISGYIADVAVEDNASIRAGEVIARIDDGDYKLAVQTARDQIAVQQATVTRITSR